MFCPRCATPLESVVLASEEGVSWFRWVDGHWRTDVLGTGEQTTFVVSPAPGGSEVSITTVAPRRSSSAFSAASASSPKRNCSRCP